MCLIPNSNQMIDRSDEIASLRAQLQQQAADLAQARQRIKELEDVVASRLKDMWLMGGENHELNHELGCTKEDLSLARRQIENNVYYVLAEARQSYIEKLEAAFLKLYIESLEKLGMSHDVAEKHGREALSAIRGQP